MQINSLLNPLDPTIANRPHDEEPEEDTYDRFIRNGQYPVR